MGPETKSASPVSSQQSAPERTIETANPSGLSLRAVAGVAGFAETEAGKLGRWNGSTAGASSMRQTNRELGKENEAQGEKEHEVDVMRALC